MRLPIDSAPQTGGRGEVIRFAPAGGLPGRAPVVLAHEQPFALGGVRIEPALRQVIHANGSTETLEPRVMEVLVALHREPGAILSRDDLTVACWHGNVVGEDAIQRVIQRLRKAAERSSGAFRIETITKVGYRLIADGTPQSETVANADPASPTRRRVSLVLAVAALVAALGAGFWLARSSGPTMVTVGLERFTATDPAQRALAARLGEAFRLQMAANGTPAQSGQTTLKVRGIVRDAGGKPELTLRIDDGASGETLWSDTAQPSLTNHSPDQSTIYDLAGHVSCGISGARNGPGASDAMTVGMLVRHCDGMRMGETAEATLDNARRLAARAPRLWAAQLAVAEAINHRLLEPADHEAALIREATAAADRAIALMPDAADAYWTKAMSMSANRPLARDALFRKAIASRFVNCACGLQYYGDFLLQSGRTSDALAMYQRGSSSETEDYGSLWRIFMAATMIGKEDVADAALARLDALGNPGIPPAASMARRFRAIRDGDYKQALALAPTGPPSRTDAVERATYAALVSGNPARKAEALASVAQVREDTKQERIKIRLLTALDETDAAFALLERSRGRGGPFSAPGRFPGMAAPLVWDPALAPLCRDPRFAGYLTRAGFMAYWRGSKSRPDVCNAGNPPPFCRLLDRPAA